jgi:transglutaminase-like putative cysteine protease
MIQGLPNLEAAPSSIELLDHRQIEWQRVQQCVYLVHQHLRYDYPGPINDLQQRLMILPADHYGNQRLLDHRLTVSNAAAEIVQQSDDFGNTEINVFVPFIERTINFEAWILVERKAGQSSHDVPATWLTDNRNISPSRLTQPDEALRKIATEFKASGEQGLKLVEHINEWVYQTISYAHDVTDIHTTAAQALALRQGVCQDYAHIMIALCHLCGIPARYVSGHLLGEGGTHAWVEVILPAENHPDLATVIPFDPTHGRSAGISYVTIAIGRDYFDVAPTSGTFRASYGGQLTADKHVGLTMYEYADTIRIDDKEY